MLVIITSDAQKSKNPVKRGGDNPINRAQRRHPSHAELMRDKNDTERAENHLFPKRSDTFLQIFVRVCGSSLSPCGGALGAGPQAASTAG